MHLQMAHQEMRDVLTKTESELFTANRKLLDQKKDLEAKLAKSEEICAKLFESGMYWRQRKFAKDSTRKIRVPIKGGGKKKTKKKSHGSSLHASGSAVLTVPAAASLAVSTATPSSAVSSSDELGPTVSGAGETPGKGTSKIRVERKPKSVHADPFTNQFF